MLSTKTMTAKELFIIREALTFLIEESQAKGETVAEFDTIAELEKQFTSAYYLIKGIN